MRHFAVFLTCLAVLLGLFFAGSAHAQDFYWTLSGSSQDNHYGSAAAACAAADYSYHPDSITTVEFKFHSLQSLNNGGASFRCIQTSTTTYSNGQSNVGPPSDYLGKMALRNGETCPDGGIYNQEKGTCPLSPEQVGKVCEVRSSASTFDKVINSEGECVLLPNADLPAQCEYLSGKGTRQMRVFVTYDDDSNPQVAPEINGLGCEATAISVAHCKLPVSKPLNGITIEHGGKFCWVDVAFTGKPFQEGATAPMPAANPAEGVEGVCPDPSQCIVPDSPVVTDSKPCNYMSNGAVVGCETTQFQGNPGEMNCGSVNGGPYGCTTRPPTSTGVSVKTEIKTTPNPGGGTTVTKDDTHTEVKCTAPGSCTTTVTKTTNVTIKDGSGNTTGSNTTCTGSKCASSTNPDANGDGLGDCVKDCDEEGEGEFKGPEIEEAKTVAETTQAFVNAVKGGPLMTAVSGISLPSGGTCHFGSTTTYIGEINFEAMCDLWAKVAPILAIVLLGAWAFLSVRIVMSA